MNDRPAARDELTVVVLDGEAVIYDDVSGDVHHLNPTATLVFQLLDGSATTEELAADVADAFGLDPGDASAQLHGLVDELSGVGLLVGTRVHDG